MTSIKNSSGWSMKLLSLIALSQETCLGRWLSDNFITYSSITRGVDGEKTQCRRVTHPEIKSYFLFTFVPELAGCCTTDKPLPPNVKATTRFWGWKYESVYNHFGDNDLHFKSRVTKTFLYNREDIRSWLDYKKVALL